jgi:arginyl-tRNA synthetase
VIEAIEIAGPYLNFKITKSAFHKFVIAPILSGEFFKRKLKGVSPKTMIEYSQPNTHKELHVGHMRNLCLGLALTNILKYSGWDVITATFPGDMGTHVAKCLWYMKLHNKEAPPKEGKGEWLGRMYSKAHIKLEDEAGTIQEEVNKKELTAIMKELESKKGEYYELWLKTRTWSIELMESVYKWAGVKFDSWYFESEVDADSVKLVNKYLSEGKLQKSEGAIGLDLSNEKLGFCLLLKSDGTGLYATKDIELARRKFEDFKIEKSVYVVDMRQALHFKQVFKVLEHLGFEQAKNCYHLQYNFVELPDGAMSSRKGNIVPLTELIHKMEAVVKSEYLSRYEGEWAPSEIEETAKIVAEGAIKYGMLMMDTNKKIVFDMPAWLKLDGESGPFIQYSYARIQSLLKKIGYNENEKVDFSVLKAHRERVLMQMLLQFNEVVLDAAENYKPAAICAYLYDLAKAFNSFYHECPIGQAETKELKNARLSLSAATGIVLSQGLKLLGIQSPNRM